MRDPGRDRHARALPRADLRGLALPRGRAHRRRRVGRPRHRRRRSLLGIALALLGLHAPPGHHRAAARAASPRLHDFLVNKWYFDELYDAVFVRPARAFGRFGRDVIESRVRAGRDRRRRDRHRARRHLVRARDPDRLPARLRAAPAARRGRPRPLLPDRGARDDPPVDRHLPAARRRPRRRRSCRARLSRWAVLAGTVAVLAYVDRDAGRLRRPAAGSSTSPTTSGSRSSASATRSASTG